MTNIVSMERIASKIYVIRDVRVMFDRDLAELYGVETRVLNQAVKRNADRFPKDFMFELNREEIMRISQIVISPKIKYSKRVHAFTEQGVAMISSVLNSKRAIEVNIAIMRAFVRLRSVLATHTDLERKLSELEAHMKDHDQQIQIIFEAIQQLLTRPKKPRKKIGFEVREGKIAYGKRIRWHSTSAF